MHADRSRNQFDVRNGLAAKRDGLAARTGWLLAGTDGRAAQTDGLAAQANGLAAQTNGLAAQTALAAHSNRGASGAVPFGNKIAAGCADPKTSALGALLVHLSHQGGIDLQAHSCELKFNRFARKGILP